ncbi:hypothetical protein ON010_g8907 [Phytophthora cinnamomi]|nr:hypothetical protein ON010_g8907 [Phytophthora cinnamomi]
MELLLRSMDKIETNSDEHNKSQVLASLEAFSTLSNFGLKNSSVQVMLERSVANFYLQKLQQPELAVPHYFEALKALSSLTPKSVDACESNYSAMLSNATRSYAEVFYQKAIAAHEQHRQRRGLSPLDDINALFHKKLGYEVLDLQLEFMEHLLSAKRWDEVRGLVEKVVEQIEDTPDLSPQDKLAEIQVVINHSVEWLAEADKAKPRIAFDIFQSRQCTGDLAQLVTRRRKVNKMWGMDPEDGVKLLEREKTLLDEFAEKVCMLFLLDFSDNELIWSGMQQIKRDDDEKETMKRAMNSYNLLKAEVPKARLGLYMQRRPPEGQLVLRPGARRVQLHERSDLCAWPRRIRFAGCAGVLPQHRRRREAALRFGAHGCVHAGGLRREPGVAEGLAQGEGHGRPRAGACRRMHDLAQPPQDSRGQDPQECPKQY